jgi:hypothetical protein
MRPLGVIVLHELAHEVVEELRPLRLEVVEVFPVHQMHAPLGPPSCSALLV